MASVDVQEAASHRIDDIDRSTREQGGAEQAERSVTGLFDAFGKMETLQVMSRPVPAEFGVDGYVFRYERHDVDWRKLNNGNIGIVTILHERMHQIDRFRDDFGL